MKKCPFCAELIQDEAIKCKHCSEFLDGRPRPPPVQYAPPPPVPGSLLPWHFRTSTIVIALLCVGPFALPLIWWHPKMSVLWKAVSTVIILILSWLSYLLLRRSIEVLMEYYRLLNNVMG